MMRPPREVLKQDRAPAATAQKARPGCRAGSLLPSVGVAAGAQRQTAARGRAHCLQSESGLACYFPTPCVFNNILGSLHLLQGLPAGAPHLACQPLRRPLLARPVHLGVAADAAENLPIEAQLLALASLLQGVSQAAGIAPVLEGVQGGTGFAAGGAGAGGFAGVGPAGGQPRRSELGRAA